MNKEPNYYKFLGVKQDASVEEIRLAYRKLAKQYHRDSNKTLTSDKDMILLNKIKDTLTDETSRLKYDNQLKAQQNYNSGYRFDASSFKYNSPYTQHYDENMHKQKQEYTSNTRYKKPENKEEKYYEYKPKHKSRLHNPFSNTRIGQILILLLKIIIPIVSLTILVLYRNVIFKNLVNFLPLDKSVATPVDALIKGSYSFLGMVLITGLFVVTYFDVIKLHPICNFIIIGTVLIIYIFAGNVERWQTMGSFTRVISIIVNSILVFAYSLLGKMIVDKLDDLDSFPTIIGLIFAIFLMCCLPYLACYLTTFNQFVVQLFNWILRIIGIVIPFLYIYILYTI